MHRIIKNKTKALQIVVIAVFMAVAAFAAQPAQAKWRVQGGYKHLSLGWNSSISASDGSVTTDENFMYSGHGVKFWVKQSLDDANKHWMGFGFGGGAMTNFKREKTVSSELLGSVSSPISSSAAVSDPGLLFVSWSYEYVFPFRLGLSSGLGIARIFWRDRSEVLGIGFSDLGLTYRFSKNGGFLLYFNTDIMGVVESEPNIYTENDSLPLLWNLGAGVGYEF